MISCGRPPRTSRYPRILRFPGRRLDLGLFRSVFSNQGRRPSATSVLKHGGPGGIPNLHARLPSVSDRLNPRPDSLCDVVALRLWPLVLRTEIDLDVACCSRTHEVGPPPAIEIEGGRRAHVCL